MNATTLFMGNQATFQKTQKADYSKHVETQRKTSEQPSRFAKMLHENVSSSRSAEATKKTVRNTTASTSNENSQAAESTQFTLRQLQTAVEQLLEMIPIDEGFIDPKLLQDPNVLAFLKQMPQEVQELLTSFIQSGQSFEELLAQTKTDSQAQLGLLLLTLYQLKSKGQLPEEFKQTDGLKTDQFLLSKLAEMVDKKSNGDDEQLSKLDKNELRQIVQRVLYTDASNQSDANNSGNQKESLGKGMPFVDGTTPKGIDEGTFDQLIASSIKEGGSVNRIQQYVLNVQQQEGSELPEDQILKQLNNIMKQSKFSTLPNGTNQLMIRLNPAHLGTLMIKLIETNGEMSARIIASSLAAKQVIEGNMNSLKHVFTTQNINVEKFEIQYQGDRQFDDANKNNGQDGNQSKQKQQDELKQNSNEEDSSEQNSFKDELLNLIV
ncbi:MAG TPA: flagellar hook-length control protein FliK [Bacillus bacterium]|nr:flagellar hook-length control protein FliK [Bacillus sp. (in: firmicutes)]